MSVLQVQAASKSFGTDPTNKNHVLENINLEISEGEFVAIVGYSGSGKSTLISLMAGLQKPDTGKVLAGGELVNEPSPERAIVFQNYSLLPWLNVYENIELAVAEIFPEKSSKEVEEHVLKYIEMVNLLPARSKKPSELSGGMRQRVSLARSLAMDPKVLLMDEPLSALDALTRATLQKEICLIWEKQKKTVVLITNDVDEGILMADRILPLTCGPGATLGPEFKVEIPRPRTKQSITNHPEYQKIRRDLVDFLINSRHTNQQTVHKDLVLPEIEPEDLSPKNTYKVGSKKPTRKQERRTEKIETN